MTPEEIAEALTCSDNSHLMIIGHAYLKLLKRIERLEECLRHAKTIAGWIECDFDGSHQKFNDAIKELDSEQA